MQLMTLITALHTKQNIKLDYLVKIIHTEAVARLEKDFEGSRFKIAEEKTPAQESYTAYGKWKSTQR